MNATRIFDVVYFNFLKNLRHETLEKIMRFRKTSKSVRKNVNWCKPLKDFIVCVKATKLFEPTRSQLTWYFEGSKLASI